MPNTKSHKSFLKKRHYSHFAKVNKNKKRRKKYQKNRKKYSVYEDNWVKYN